MSLSDSGSSGAGLNAAIPASYSPADVSSDSASASDYGSMTTYSTHRGHTTGGRRTLNWNLQNRASKVPVVQNVTRGQVLNLTHGQVMRVISGHVENVTHGQNVIPGQVQNVTRSQVQDVTGGQSTRYEGLPAGSGQAYPVYDVSACSGGQADVNNSRGIVTFRFEAATPPTDYRCRVYIRVPEEQYINLTVLG